MSRPSCSQGATQDRIAWGLNSCIVATASGMPMVGFLLGLALTAHSLWQMARFTTERGAWDIVHTGFTQGLELGFTFVPLPTITFATLAPHYRNESSMRTSACRASAFRAKGLMAFNPERSGR